MNLEARSALGGRLGVASPIAELTGPGVKLIERADLGTVLCVTAGDATAILDRLSQAIGLPCPAAAGETSSKGGRTALWLSPRSWLIQCLPEDEDSLVDAVNDRFADKIVHASRFTDYLCWLELSGPGADGLCKRMGFMSFEFGGLPVGHVKRTLLAAVTVVIARRTADIWWLGVERSRTRYLVDRLAAGADFPINHG